MVSSLNTTSPIPLYRQLADLLAERIRSGEYAAGTKLPSEPSLAESFEIGRPTVRQATELLVRERLVERRRGAGTFVLHPSNAVDLFSLSGTLASFKQQGIDLRATLVRGLTKAVVTGAEHNPFSGRAAYSFTRLSCIKQRPVLLEELFLDPVVFPDLERFNLEGTSLSRVVHKDYHLSPRSATQHFSALLPEAEVARLLKIRQKPVLLVHRYIHFEHAQSAIYSLMHCRTDELVFSQTLSTTTASPLSIAH